MHSDLALWPFCRQGYTTDLSILTSACTDAKWVTSLSHSISESHTPGAFVSPKGVQTLWSSVYVSSLSEHHVHLSQMHCHVILFNVPCLPVEQRHEAAIKRTMDACPCDPCVCSRSPSEAFNMFHAILTNA